MTRFRISFLLIFAAASAGAAERDPATLARRIDQHLAARWKQENVQPAAKADDAEFLRRAYLDLIGRIPTVTEAREFLADRTPDKREKLIDRLVAQPGYETHFARVWCRHWLPQTAAQFEELRPEFEDWLREQLRANVPYDQMVRSLVRATGGPRTERSVQVFLQANEYKPANLAGNTARFFLGINLDCAQCHDHPFARWSKDQFWSFAAFFADPTASGDGKPTKPARFIDGSEPGEATDRTAMATWITSPKNPYFAKNAVNRVWADLFGTGLVEPIDDLSGAVPASHPQLLNELADAFVECGYDLRFLLRSLTRTQAYQLSSAGPSPAPPPHLFARFALRTMSGDQLFESLTLAAGIEARDADRTQFLVRFGRPERPSQAGRTILQSLTLMNGRLTADATALTGHGMLAAIVDAPFLDTAARIESLYLAALTRSPRAEEKKRLVALIESSPEPRRVLATVFWTLLNSHEFAVIH